MEYILRTIHKAGVFGLIFFITLLYGFYVFSTQYINSSYLEEYVSKSDVGFIYTTSSLLTLLILAVASRIITVFGVYRTMLFGVLASAALSLALVFAHDFRLIVVLFTVRTMLIPLNLLCLDLFLENSMTSEEKTGTVRGIFLSMSILAALFAPVISGFAVGDAAVYTNAYLVSALYLIPALFLLHFKMRSFKERAPERISFIRMIRAIWNNKDLLHVSSAQFLLRFFFSLMVVYMPIYLHEVVGFSWPQIGIIFFIMLIPYILIEYPAGVIADKWIGEKELMFAGFVLVSITTGMLFFVQSDSIIVWAGMLLLTRIGAALIESMTESYFFKQIDGDDVSILSIFRMLRPLAYAIGPFTGAVVLYFLPMRYLWVILALVMFTGVVHALFLKDTK